ncbi:hypothetical protein [Nonomuraea sp. NPDC005692]|uniref:hypothetical protein n=1 Tax=Nonomuraea sp. NPDC005692 TaxID=3157168 RepID=UPI0033D6C1A8
MISIPPRTATDVVARGLELSEVGGVLHYEFVPGVRDEETDGKGPFWYWRLSAEDDLGTEYSGDNIGGFDGKGGRAAHGSRYLGGVVPRSARRLSIGFEPAWGWTPPGPWCRRLEVALPDGPVTEVWTGPYEGD